MPQINKYAGLDLIGKEVYFKTHGKIFDSSKVAYSYITFCFSSGVDTKVCSFIIFTSKKAKWGKTTTIPPFVVTLGNYKKMINNQDGWGIR